MRSFEAELRAAHLWADEADRTAMAAFTRGITVERKSDGTPVTQADRAIEAGLRRSIESEFPSDAVLGEEEGFNPGGSGSRRWILDPIDGTKNFIRGIPIFATLIALEEDGKLVLGFVSAPALRARWWATLGGGAFRDGEPIHVSGVAELSRALVASGGIDSFRTRGLLDGFIAVASAVERQRGFGDFWGHMLVAQGSAEAMIEPLLSAWDIAAPKLIVEEAGGRLTSLAGEDRFDAGDCLTTNGLLHDQILKILRT